MIDDETWRRLEETSVLIYDTNGSVGSGYIVARGYVGTAAHVVKRWNVGEPRKVFIGWGKLREVSATLIDREEKTDAAILFLNDSVDVEPFPLGELPLAGTVWGGFGYPRAARVDNVAVGVPLNGLVNNAGWKNQHGHRRMLLKADEAAAAQGTPMHGWSGSPIVAGGKLVGHVCEQFGDPDDKSRPAWGFVKACPISAVTALFKDKTATFGTSAPVEAEVPKHRPAAVLPTDIHLLPSLLAWCDRDAIVTQVRKWLLNPHAQSAGVLCLVGHSDNRENLLLQRVADELSGKDPQIFTRFKNVDEFHELEDAEAFRYVGNLELGVVSDGDIPSSKHYQDGAKLVLLNLTCDCDKWSSKKISQKICHATEWLHGLSLGNVRLILVLTMRHGAPPPFNADIEKRVTAAVKAASKNNLTAFKACRTGDLIVLENYSSEHVISWRNKPVVMSGLGSIWSALDDTTVREWFGGSKRSHGELEKLLKEFHKTNATSDRRNA